VCGSIRVWLDTVAEHFQAAQAEGAIRADLDPAMLAQVAVGGFLGAQAITDQLRDDRFAERVESLIQVIQSAALEREDHELRRDHRGRARRGGVHRNAPGA
jgi:hypothetical protein